ncbi:cannabidiolic acid synthase-like [Morus notabilis]|uniref:cannabidiolic acid synthase-like n=1 Tax=Morus notabilis TaxID=981085 RepID=UPI000CED7F62|nr:cannabidiolic acid synthase-like [Morus notabilis]
MKYFTFSSFFAKIIIFLFPYALLASSDHTHEHFLQCLTTRISNLTSTNETIIYTQNDASYSTVLNSSIQNQRFNTESTAKPFAIITPLNVSHIQVTVYCSQKHGMLIKVRSGGHDYEGLSYVSNQLPFIILELRNLSSISVDAEGKSAWVQAGATLGEVYYWVANKTGNILGFPAGGCGSVGVGGHLGGGGYGYLARKYGLAADNVVDAVIIDAQGRILDRNSMGEDLFWAIRGGGAASFGIVVAWKLRLVPVPSTVTVFKVPRDMADDATKKLVHRWQRRAHKVDEDLTIFIRFLTVNSTDKKGNKKIVIQPNFMTTFLGGADTLLQLMQKEFPEMGLVREDCTELTYVQSFQYFYAQGNGSLDVLLDRTTQFNDLAFKVKSDYVKEPIPDDVLKGMLERMYDEEVGRVLIDFYPYGGEMNNFSESAIPFPHRAGNIFNIHYQVTWKGESKKHLSWIRRLYNSMTPYMSKNPRTAYLNFRDLDIGMNEKRSNTTSTLTRIAKANIWGTKYFKNNFNKLIQVKTKVDPADFFRNEQSIPSLLSP